MWKHTPGLRKYDTTDLTFNLIVDDFGIKYTDTNQAQHLLNSLKDKHVALEWCCINRKVTLSTPGHVKKLLIKYSHSIPSRWKHTPRETEPIKNGDKQQTNVLDKSESLTSDEMQTFLSILGSLLHYSRMIYLIISIAVNDLSIVKTNATLTSRKLLNALLDYLHINPDAKITRKNHIW